MKKIILLYFLAFCSVVSASTYYVAPGGKDSNPGTFSQPWKTWGKAFNSTSVNAGDTVYFRGGVYMKDLAEGDDCWYYPCRSNGGNGYGITRDGTIGDTLCYFAYPGEVPILDCYNVEPTFWLHYGIRAVDVKYVKFKGLSVRNVRQINSSMMCWGVSIGGNNLIIENCTFYNMHGEGLIIVSEAGTYTYIINCDAYNCCDSLTTELPGNDGTGFTCHSPGNVYFRYCRAWLCGDQGFTTGILFPASSTQYIEYDGCWSFRNGLIEGVGNGYKMGWIEYTNGSLKRIYKNCIAAYNRSSGFKTNDYYPNFAINVHAYNNTSYHNGYYPGYIDTDGPGAAGFALNNSHDADENELKRVLLNNIAYDDQAGSTFLGENSIYTHENNSWDTPPNVTITDADFISVDSTGLSGPRQADGSLPDLNFLKLSPTSHLIDAGTTSTGLPYNGKAPDLGAYEYDPQPGSNKYPSIVISSPSVGSTFTAPATITIIANATDADGSIINVQFFNGAVKLGEKTLSPWSFTWNNVPEGTYSLTAVATDNSDAKTTSLAASITVNNPTPVPNQPLVITIINPVTGSTFSAPATITITASISDPENKVSKVEFFNGTTYLGEKTSAPWSIEWNSVPFGTYSLTAVATDNLNTKTTSSSVAITVNNLPPVINQPPIVSIVTPAKGQKYYKYAEIVIDAVASDPDGKISKVEFYNGINKLSEINTAPYSYTWKYVDEGTYSITAMATDNLNAIITSSPVWVEVEAGSFYEVNSEIFNLYPNPNDGRFSIVITEPLEDANRKITIITLNGKSIYNEPLLEGEITKQFDLSYIKPGTYTLIILSSIGIIATKQFIKN
jgi:hypothetical protein